MASLSAVGVAIDPSMNDTVCTACSVWGACVCATRTHCVHIYTLSFSHIAFSHIALCGLQLLYTTHLTCLCLRGRCAHVLATYYELVIIV
jgi:hypothetical protein